MVEQIQETDAPPSGDPAALAFEALREEVALVRRAIAGLAAELASLEIPDYSETLGQIMRAGAASARNLKALSEMPALRLSARGWAQEINAASEEARRLDHEAMIGARQTFQQAEHDLRSSLQSARLAADQRQWLIGTAIAAGLAGMFLLALCLGPIVRAAPVSWQWSESVAASIMGMNQEVAGERLIETAAPDRWRDIVLGYRIVNKNHDTINSCENRMPKLAKLTRCVITISKN